MKRANMDGRQLRRSVHALENLEHQSNKLKARKEELLALTDRDEDANVELNAVDGALIKKKEESKALKGRIEILRSKTPERFQTI